MTWIVARYGPQGGADAPWSFRGNGALIVPFGLGPAMVAGVWTALVLHYRSVAHWRLWSIASGLVGTGFAAGSVLLLIVFGSDAQRPSDWLSVASVGWMVVAPVIAIVVPPVQHRDGRRVSLHVAAGLAFTLSVVLGFVLTGLAVPPGS